VNADESAARLRLLYDCCCAFAARLDLDELVPLVLTKCRDALQAEAAAVLLLDEEHDELDFSYLGDQAPDVAERLRTLRMPASRGIAGAVLRDRTPVRVDDARTDSRFYPDVDRATGLETCGLLCVPLLGTDAALGVLQVVNRRDGARFTDDDLEFLEGLAAGVAVAIANARVLTQVKGEERRLRAQVGVLRRDLARRDGFAEMVGSGSAMASVFRLMESAATSQIPVLIEGETGTGKELVGRGIHRASARAEGPFVAVNCAALPEALLESELFGHRRGAFTGAIQDRPGLFQTAHGGTLFLDEIGEMPAAMQAKLLRVLQEGEVMAVGDTKPRKIDVRVVSATNRDLETEVEQGNFRQDLYFRVATFPIGLPPLRERREDVPLLAERVLLASAKRHGKRILGFTTEVLAAFERFAWPGNVRELENEIERAVALARDGHEIGLEHLSAKLTRGTPAGVASTGGGSPVPVAALTVDGPLREARDAFEIVYIRKALEQHSGNVTRTAQALGLSRVMLQKKMKEYGLRTP
jgi:Nif-specific regulatory protein